MWASALTEDAFQAAVRSAGLLQTVKYMNVAGFTIMVFDYFVTLEAEISLIWNSKWGLGKILYLLTRYTAFVDVPLVLYYSLPAQVPLDHCFPVYAASSWSTAFGIGMAEAILLLRTYALWGCNRKILLGLSTLYVVIYTGVIVILVLFLRSLEYGPPLLPIISGCHPSEGSIVVLGDFALIVLNETIIMILTLWIGVRNFRHSPNPLVTTLYRDGILYYVYIFLISLGNIFVLVAGPPEFVDLLNTFQRVMHSLVATRIMLHVREGSQARRSAQPISQLRFESPPHKFRTRADELGLDSADTSGGLGTVRTIQTRSELEALGP